MKQPSPGHSAGADATRQSHANTVFGGIELGLYSVQWFESDPGPCVECGEAIGAGPAGFTTDDPSGAVCDACLLRGDRNLGMLIWLAHVAREMAGQASGEEDPWEADKSMVALMTFCKLYHQGAGWPCRESRAADFIRGLKMAMAKVKLDDLLNRKIP